jgi:transposase
LQQAVTIENCLSCVRNKLLLLLLALTLLTGGSYFYEFSHLDHECFQLFINQVSQVFSDSLNFIQIDNAPAHQNIEWPENIIPIFQPAYSPELNPIERFWEYLKSKLSWKNFSNIQELIPFFYKAALNK